MSIQNSVEQAYPGLYISSLTENYTEISVCKDIYKGQPPWQEVKKGGLSAQAKGKRLLGNLNASKALADEFATLVFAEQVEITVDDELAQTYLLEQLQANGFWKNIPCFLSSVYALGGGIFKVYAENKAPRIDYVSCENFVPTAWSNKDILEGVFQTVTIKGKYTYSLLERHFIQSGVLCVENKLYRSENRAELGEEVALEELYYNLPPLIRYDGLSSKMFHYIKPSVSNNIDFDSPLGISIFSNAKDTLKSLDIAFDSFGREFILGRKRIIVPSSCIRTVVDTDSGETVRYFDADDEVYEALKCDVDKDLNITDNTVELRIEEHINAINALLNILCFQTGLSAGTLSFTGGEGVKTATEIISRDSKTARTIKNNKNLLAEAIEGVCHAILGLGAWYGDISAKDYTVTIGFKDNIVIDDNTLIDNNIKLVQAGLKSKISAIMEVLKCDEKTAQEELERINKEQDVTALAVDNFGGGDE